MQSIAPTLIIQMRKAQQPRGARPVARREALAGNYYHVLQPDPAGNSQDGHDIFVPMKTACCMQPTYETGYGLLHPQTLSPKGQAAFHKATMELKGTMGWVYSAL